MVVRGNQVGINREADDRHISGICRVCKPAREGLIKHRAERAARRDFNAICAALTCKLGRVLEADFAALDEALERVAGDRDIGHASEPTGL